MSEDAPKPKPPEFVPPVSSFMGPIAELIAQRMLLPPSRPGVLAMLDQYEILRVLGGGGMGIVLLGRDPDTAHEVAVKLVKSDLLANQTVVHRFLREAGHLKRLRHTNVVPVFAISDRVEGPYFVMPYFEKGSLAGRIKPGKPLDAGSILDISAQVAEGLSFAHRSGIIHRDLKPANILLAADGTACLADFGLARTLFNDTLVDGENRNLEGTAPYMSPAVAAGDAEDTRCDIYSFGALLYEMLTGNPPYKGRGTKEILDQIIAGPPKPVLSVNSDADRALVAVAEGCMARELRDRYADMRDVVSDLQRFKENKPPLGPRGFTGAGDDQSLPARHVLKIIGIPVCLAAIAFVGWILWRGHPSVPVTPPAVATPVAPSQSVSNQPASTQPVPSQPVSSQPTPGTTLLAGKIGVGGSVDGPGNQALFRLPNSLAVDSSGNVYVADTANNTIRKIAPSCLVSTLAGVAGVHGYADADISGSDARFWAPFGLAVDSAGNVYVADTANNLIREITPNGVVSTLAGMPGHAGSKDGGGSFAQFRNPWGVAVDDTGNVFVADMSNDTIRKISPSGAVTTFAGRAGLGGSTDGVGTQARFNHPFAIAVDHADNIYVSDSANDTIRKITADGIVTTLAGLPGFVGSKDGTGADARFSNPQGLVVDNRGNIYAADTGNNAIRKISPLGVVTTLSGFGGTAANDVATTLNAPAGLALDRDGNLYVADTGNHVIRKTTFLSSVHP